MSSSKAVKIIVEGRVQGVWFRGWVTQEATERNLDGWVRNCTDGSVEALFSGPAADVYDMVLACHQGPPMARVDVLSEDPAAPPDETGFRSLPTF
ncbi:MAG: acylphosphatase [Rhodospirillales bacterium]